MCNMIIDFLIFVNFSKNEFLSEIIDITRNCDKKITKNLQNNVIKSKKNLTKMGNCVIIDDNPKK